MDLISILNNIFKEAFKKENYNCNFDNYVQMCNIPSMGDFQCNIALSLAKEYKTAPIKIAETIKKSIENCDIIQSCSVAAPGYINFFINNNFLNDCLNDKYLNFSKKMKYDNKKIIIDYGGANVAKPLHVGHLRSATIGESIKRICKFVGNTTIGDVHLGDWGLQMGMIIYELSGRHPEWNYFDKNYQGEYQKSPPLTIKDLETIYPEANAKAKNDEFYMNQARLATYELQKGRRGYLELWKQIVNVSKKDLKKNYDSLDVNFDLWRGESDSQPYCDLVIEKIVKDGFSKESQGALVVDVSEPSDKNEIPPFILKKNDGAVLYSTTDLATIYQRELEFNPDEIIYVVDNRQEMHFTQLFRCVNKTKLTKKDIIYSFAGFGTMNGKDGKPYKTRDGGVMQLKHLIKDVKNKAYEKVLDAKKQEVKFTEKQMERISDKVAVSALKFADLSIYRTKDYVFDIEKFCSFDGKTGPYILYTITRGISILKKANFKKQDIQFNSKYYDKQLLFSLLTYQNEIIKAYNELSPNIICDFVYKLANQFNSFYNSCNIINEKNQEKKIALLSLTNFTVKILTRMMHLLGIKTLNRM